MKKRSRSRKRRFTDKNLTLEKNSDVLQNDDLRKELFDAQRKVDQLTLEEIQGNIIKARVNWFEKGERSTKYFFGL